jgi:hypothetical protein
VCLQLTYLVSFFFSWPVSTPQPILLAKSIVVERRIDPYTSMLRSVSRIRNVCCFKVVSYSLVVQFLNVLNGWYIGVSISMTGFLLNGRGVFFPGNREHTYVHRKLRNDTKLKKHKKLKQSADLVPNKSCTSKSPNLIEIATTLVAHITT